MSRLDRLNARLAARRTRILAVPELRAVLARAGLEPRLAALRATAAGASLARPPPAGGDPLAAAEAALHGALAGEAAILLREAEGKRARRLLAAFLALDEAEHVKAVIRGVASGAAPEAILAAAPPAPGVPPMALRAAAAAHEVAEALGILVAAGSAVAAAAAAALPPDARIGLAAVELAAERAALARAGAACRGRGEDATLLRSHLAARIDGRNVATLLLVAGGNPAPDAWLPGGHRLSVKALARAAREGPDAARALAVRAFPALALAGRDPWAVDRALEAAMVAELRRTARRAPLSIAVVLRHLAERRQEVRRVALLLRGAEAGVPGESLLDLVEA